MLKNNGLMAYASGRLPEICLRGRQSTWPKCPLSGQVVLGSTAATAEVAIENVKLSQPRGSPQGVPALKTATCEGNLGDTGDTVSA